jgi:hypothetical protein
MGDAGLILANARPGARHRRYARGREPPRSNVSAPRSPPLPRRLASSRRDSDSAASNYLGLELPVVVSSGAD